MRWINQATGMILVILFVTACMCSCATIPQLTVEYRLPPASDSLKGRSVALIVEDSGISKAFMGEGARMEFENFPGNINFSLAGPNRQGARIGIFQAREMILEGFKRRLENEGLQVPVSASPGDLQLLIVVEEFHLDLVDSRWKARMGYEAKILAGGRAVASQTISGEAERYKFVGREGADIAMGEIFTDLVNRLDVKKLLDHADRFER